MRRLIAGTLTLGAAVLVLAAGAEDPRRQGTSSPAPALATAGAPPAVPRDPAVSFLPDGDGTGPGASFVARGKRFAATVSASCAVVTQIEPLWDEERVAGALTDPSLYVAARSAPRRARHVRIEMLGGDADAPAIPADRLGFPTNVFLGDDPAQWRRGVPSYGRTTFAGVWPGVDVEWHGDNGALEFDLVVAPGADPAVIALRGRSGRRDDVDPRPARRVARLR